MIEQQKLTDVRSESGLKCSPCFLPVVSSMRLTCYNVPLGQDTEKPHQKSIPANWENASVHTQCS